MISIAVLVLSDLSSTTIRFPIEAAAQKQGNTINLLTNNNNNNTITKANTANNNLINEGISPLVLGK